MPATFGATFSAVAVSAESDLFEIVAPSTSRVDIRSISLGSPRRSSMWVAISASVMSLCTSISARISAACASIAG